jgi:hypothetical protein
MNQSSLMITTIAARSRAFCGTESFLQYVGGCGGLRDHFVYHLISAEDDRCSLS